MVGIHKSARFEVSKAGKNFRTRLTDVSIQQIAVRELAKKHLHSETR